MDIFLQLHQAIFTYLVSCKCHRTIVALVSELIFPFGGWISFSIKKMLFIYLFKKYSTALSYYFSELTGAKFNIYTGSNRQPFTLMS